VVPQFSAHRVEVVAERISDVVVMGVAARPGPAMRSMVGLSSPSMSLR
jgi:hypothetical protein